MGRPSMGGVGSGMGRPGMGPGGAPGVGVHGAMQRRPGAGANRARNQIKEIDRFKIELKKKRAEYEQKRHGLGKFVRKDDRKDKKGKMKERAEPESMTRTMRVNTPGTPEHEERKKAIAERIGKARKKGAKIPEIMVSKPGRPLPVLKKENLPYTKDVRKPTLIKKIPIAKRLRKMSSEEELILDSSLSFVVGLENGVFMEAAKELDWKQRKALMDYLDLMSVALPPEWGLHKLIDDLRNRFAFICQSDKNLKTVIDQHPLPRRQWSKSCTPKQNSRLGFSCGFWKLMHVAAVGVAEQRGGLNLIESGMVGFETNTFSPIEAADAFRDYIDNFFTCAPCKDKFIKNYDNCEKNRRCDRLTEEDEDATISDWKELPIWLWEVHNEVSIGIIQESAAKANKYATRVVVKDEITGIWPNIDNCFMCFKNDGTWDEEEVFKLLEKTYW
jgi:hypothetical protein